MCYHYGTAFPTDRSGIAHRTLAGLSITRAYVDWTWYGWVGVEVFFVISGYVIFASAAHARPASFAAARFLRLAPAAWLCATATALILMTAMTHGDHAAIAMAWARSVTFMPLGQQIDGSYWTLGIEVSFYLAVALGLARANDPASLVRTIACVGALSLDYWLVEAAFADAIPYPGRMRMLLLLPHGVFFALGGLIRHYRAGRRPGAIGAGFIAALLWACTLEIVVHNRQIGADAGIGQGPVIPVAIFLTAVLLLVFAEALQPACRRVFPDGLTARLGLVTYPLYLIHQAAGAVIMAGLLHRGATYPAAAISTATWALVFAWICASSVEPAMRRRLRTFSPFRAPGPDMPRTASPPAG